MVCIEKFEGETILYLALQQVVSSHGESKMLNQLPQE